jgi:hypothetical protein
MLAQACDRFVKTRGDEERCIRCGHLLLAHGAGLARRAAPKTAKIWADTLRRESCSYVRCAQVLYFAQLIKTQRWIPFTGRPTPLAQEQEIQTLRQIWTVDLAQSHFATCIGAQSFRRRR